MLVYEKACTCPESSSHPHSEICCGQQMKVIVKGEPAKK